MIYSFRSRESEALFRRANTIHIPPDIDRAALRRLVYLDAARDLRDLIAPPAFSLAHIRGEREGRYALHITGDWYICFECRRANLLASALAETADLRKSP